MSDGVKPRRYSSPRRDEQAEQTRERVLFAAASLFEQRGFAGTSVAAIAEAAEVAEETVYARFRTKRALLAELVSRAVRGDDPRPVLEQEGPRSVAAATDQRLQLRLFATDVAARVERAAPLVAILSGAARAEPELAALLEQLHATRQRNLATFVDALAANGLLRLPRGRAVDTVWALASPELFELLVRVRGWTTRDYADWLADVLTASLLPPEP